MGKSNEFVVQFSGLKLGTHSFEFKVGNSFFEKLEYSPFKEGEVDVKVVMEKKSSMLTLNFALTGWIKTNCDRCAVDYKQPINGENQVHVKFGDDFEELDDNLIVIPRDEYEIDISQLIYEFIGLSIPLRNVPCEEEGDTSICDQETLKLWEESDSEEEKINPLWAKLNDIKGQLED